MAPLSHATCTPAVAESRYSARGGNAVDAVIAAGLTLAVTAPGSASLGGSGALLLRRADGQTFFLDFTAKPPATASPDREGIRGAALPGLLRGLEVAARNHGSKTWAELVRPAAKLASSGFQLLPTASTELLEKPASDRLKKDPEAFRILLKSGKQFMTNEILEQPELARTLERIAARGASDFYEGETARQLVKALAAGGSTITAGDLKSVKVTESKPLEGAYRGHRILSAPSPLAGGAGLIDILSALDGSGFEKHEVDTAASLHLRGELFRRAFAARTTVDLSREGHGGAAAVAADSRGNVAVLVITMGSRFGSAGMASGLGFLLNDELKNPQRLPAPAIILKAGAPRLALCGLGGPAGMTVASQILVDVIDFGIDVEQALNSPRFHYQGLPGEFVLERSYPPHTRQGLEERGHKLGTSTVGLGEVEALGIGAPGTAIRFRGAVEGRAAGAPRAY